MIDISNISKKSPYKKFKQTYSEALAANQPNIEAICISSFDKEKQESDSRFVNLKYIINDDWIFFSNYLSPKANQFQNCEKISAVFFWSEINVQIRLKAKIYKAPSKFSDNYFKKRDAEKNILAIISNQSQKIDSYQDFIDKYNENSEKDCLDAKTRPNYWGGYSFKPYYFEFWHGHDKRINKREAFMYEKNKWNNFCLEP